MKIKFPKEFMWGGAVSAEQTEGLNPIKKAKTVYDVQFEATPNDFFDNNGPQNTCDFMNKYKEDVALWKKLGINSHRTSFSWARIFPEGDYKKPNIEAVNWYHSFIDEMINNGITPFFTLYHFDMPEYAMKKGGWMSREVWSDFLEYSKFVLNEFSSKVRYWTTMNEPWVPMEVSYFGNIQHPKLNSDQAGADAGYGIVMSHALVVNYFNEFVKDKYPKNEIGGIFNSTVVYPKDQNNPDDVKAAHYFELFQFTGMTDAMVSGKWHPDMGPWLREMEIFPRNFDSKDIDTLAKVKLDFIGLNFYQPLRAQKPTKLSDRKPFNYFEAYKMPSRRENKFRGWEIYPEALFDTIKLMSERYGKDKKFMLTEYGMGVQRESRFRDSSGKINDQYRVVFMKEHLVQLARVIDELGLEVMGAHCWATFDCWSWCNAFKNTYGLIEVDLKTQIRTPKSSAYFLSDVIKNNGFDYENEKTEDYIDFN